MGQVVYISLEALDMILASRFRGLWMPTHCNLCLTTGGFQISCKSFIVIRLIKARS